MRLPEKPVRILIADDHELMRRGVRDLLIREGYEMAGEAGTGRDLIQRAMETRPDLLIVDVGMPGLNGLEAIKRVRKEMPQVRAIVLTMHETDALIRSVMASGARGYVLKTDAARDLLAAVEAVMQGRVFLSSVVSERLRNPNLLPDQLNLAEITPREREVLQLLAEGKTSREIAETLGTSVRTVETQRSSIMEKIGARSLADVVRWAIRNNIVLP